VRLRVAWMHCSVGTRVQRASGIRTMSSESLDRMISRETVACGMASTFEITWTMALAKEATCSILT
jgi:hypothetical protein